MSEKVPKLRREVVDRVLTGPGETTPAQRTAAFGNAGVDPRATALIDKVTRHAYKVTDEDIAEAKAAGLTEDQLFELCVVAALGQSTRQLDSALAALADAKDGTR